MAAPITPVSTNEPINHGEADFDPVSHGKKADQRYLDAMQESHQAEIERIQRDSEARTKDLRDEISALRQDVREASVKREPVEPTISPEERYRLNPEEQETYGDLLGTVDKRAAMYAEKAHNAAIEQASSLFSTREQALRQEIEALKARVDQHGAGISQNFEATARARAANYGLNIDNLQADEGWNTLMDQPISAVSDTTYSQYVKTAIGTQDMASLERVFQYYATEYKRPSGPSLTGLPGSGRRESSSTVTRDSSPAGADQILNELQALENQRGQLRDDINRRRISIDEYASKIADLDKKVIALRQKLT